MNHSQKNKSFWIGILIIITLIGAGYFYFSEERGETNFYGIGGRVLSVGTDSIVVETVAIPYESVDVSLGDKWQWIVSVTDSTNVRRLIEHGEEYDVAVLIDDRWIAQEGSFADIMVGDSIIITSAAPLQDQFSLAEKHMTAAAIDVYKK